MLDKHTHNEFHKNGNLAYTETIAILAPSSAHLYEHRRVHPDGHEWIRTGRNAKYFDNGQLAWELNYDEMGKVIKNDKKNYRKDGTVIIH